ncbi:MAG: hypothetical protein LBF51_09000 [Zoogloeaceae bacterium]|nr:hypothetical protein [Zoogloeaceae bacterium]
MGKGFSPLENGYGRNPGRGRGLNLRAFLTGWVSNRSSFYDEQRVILPRVLATPKDVIGRYAAVDIVQNRDELSRQILKDMQDFFLPMGIVIESINMENIDFSNTYEQSVEARMQAEVEVQKVKQNLERERLNAEIVRVSAQGEAERWDGKLPETMIPNQGLPILGVKNRE